VFGIWSVFPTPNTEHLCCAFWFLLLSVVLLSAAAAQPESASQQSAWPSPLPFAGYYLAGLLALVFLTYYLWNRRLQRAVQRKSQQLEATQRDLVASNRELQALVAFSRAATSARTLEEFVHHMATTVRAHFGFDRVGIFLVEGERVRGVLGTDEHGYDEDISREGWTLSGEAPWASIASGERDYIYTADAAGDTGLHTRSGKPVRHHVLLPLKAQDQIMGVIAIDNAITDRPFGEPEIAPLMAFARHAAIALQNVRLMDVLRESEERLRTLITSLSEMVYSARVENNRLRFVFCSPQIERLTGYAAEEACAEEDFWLRLIHPDDQTRYLDSVAGLVNSALMPIEYRIVRREGDTRWVLDAPVPVRDNQGRIVRLNGTVLDITEQKRLENRLRQAQKMETVGTLASGIAHEFNNLLLIISASVELAQMELEREHPAGHYLERVGRAIERATSLTKQLLTFSREQATVCAVISLSALIEETRRLLQPLLGKNIDLVVITEPDVKTVYADPGQIQQVLINLCVNARDAMPDGGRISVLLSNFHLHATNRERPIHFPPGDYVRLQIGDTGVGMDEPTRGRIFEPFFTTKPVGHGTGLGLAVAYAIISDHHGWIDVQSAPGQGTIFSIFLPAYEAGAMAETTSAAQDGPV